MRPGRFHPGNSKPRQAVVAVGAASMRPGRFHPGNNRTRNKGEGVYRASMRPGRFHPGNAATFQARPYQEGSFNEAGAFPPRKSHPEIGFRMANTLTNITPRRFHPGNPIPKSAHGAELSVRLGFSTPFASGGRFVFSNMQIVRQTHIIIRPISL